MDVLTGRQVGIDAGQQETVEKEYPNDHHGGQHDGQQADFGRLYGQDIADQVTGILGKAPGRMTTSTGSFFANPLSTQRNLCPANSAR